MTKIDAVLVLGCNGHSNDGFVICGGIHNPILYLKDLDDFKYEEIAVFLDDACNLFNSPTNDYNKCSNILNILYKKYKVFRPEMLNNIQYYLSIHKKCGPFLALMLSEDYDGK